MNKAKKAKIKGAELMQTLPSPTNDEYDTKRHMDTLMEAHGIMNDPEKMKKIHKLAGRHAKAIAGIKGIKNLQDVKDYANKKYGPGTALNSLQGSEADSDNEGS